MREQNQGSGAGGDQSGMVQAGFTIWQDAGVAQDRSGGEDPRKVGGKHAEDSGEEAEEELGNPGSEADRLQPGPETERDSARSRQGPEGVPQKPTMDDIRAFAEKAFGLGESFDVVMREMTHGGRRTALVFMNGFGKDYILTDVLTRLTYLDPSRISADALHDFLELYVPAVQVTKETKPDKLIEAVLSGSSALFIEHENAALVIDAKNFPARSPEEPSLERVVRGSRDGFVETLMTNITLVRRRLRDTKLRYKLLKVGRRTRTDVCIAYLDDVADKTLVRELERKIGALDIDGLPMADKQLEEAIAKRGWNPFPLSRYSERPDVVAGHLLDGSVAVFVDTSPSVMLLPTTYFDLVRHAEERRQTPTVGTYLRWVRYFGMFASVYLLPLWFLFVLNPTLLPPGMSFIGPTESGRLPILLQFLLAEIGIDLMRMASVHTPAPLATAASLVSAILIGDIAVSTGLFINEVILYIAVAAVGMFATPSYELGLANRIVRLILLVAVALFRETGFMVVSTIVLIILARERSYTKPYLWPFIPFNAQSMLGIVFRRPFMSARMRPAIMNPHDPDRRSERTKAKSTNDE